MTTATKDKPKKTKKPADPPVAETEGVDPAGVQDSTDSPSEAGMLSRRLADFGFAVPEALIEQWDATTLDTITRTVNRWMEEFVAAKEGKPVIVEDRTPIPPLLATMEQVDPLTAKKAQFEAGEARKQEPAFEVHNPYPPESALAKIWDEAVDAIDATKPPAPETTPPVAETKGSPPDLTNAANAVELAVKRDAEIRLDRDRQQQQLAIEAAQHDMEEAVEHQAELEDQLVDMKAEMKELKASFDNAGTRARKASKALQRARAGVFERTLPFPRDAKPATLEVPDQDIGGKAEPAKPAEPVRDEGAFVLLDNLEKGELQQYLELTDKPDLGISEKQVEMLKAAVGGTGTVGDLEQFIRTHGEWWHKEIKGVGPEVKTKIDNALAAVRDKYPIPVVVDPNAVEPMPFADAVASLEQLVKDCARVADECDDDGGETFAESVGSEAAKMLRGIKEFGSVTTGQAEAIRNWKEGVGNWYDRLDDEDHDEDEDELDVPDEE